MKVIMGIISAFPEAGVAYYEAIRAIWASLASTILSVSQSVASGIKGGALGAWTIEPLPMEVCHISMFCI
jgi:hypothetical protein